eukprot:scaffold188688_cov31-Tisochrysis_lutea.AAC.1
MSLPAMAHAVICCAWNCEGEQIHTASTSGWLMTSMSESVHAIPGYVAAAAFAFEMVGFEMMIGLAAGHEESASRWTSPIRPAPMMPTPMRRSSRAASFSESEMSDAESPPLQPASAPAVSSESIGGAPPVLLALSGWGGAGRGEREKGKELKRGGRESGAPS